MEHEYGAVQTEADAARMITSRVVERDMTLAEALKSVLEEEDLNQYWQIQFSRWYTEAIKPPDMVRILM